MIHCFIICCLNELCKFFREYNRCKVSEWCAFKLQINNPGSDGMKQIDEKLDNRTKAIKKKDQPIDNLVGKMRPNEDKLKRKQQIIEEICEHKINFVHKPNCKVPL